MTSTNNNQFRTDINGLRAWAVVLVVLFHFGAQGAGAGFIGVDIFFVISGFLMTGIIIRGLEKSSSAKPFSVLNFYLSRALRIIPALFVLCLVLLAIGWFYLPPVDYEQLGKHTAAALGFVSNIVFWKEVGYFDPDSHQKLLLHTWSLSVEWQFYLLLPLAVVGAWKIRPSRRFVTVFLITGTLASMALCFLLSPTKTSTAFFLLPTRAWEMLAGGLVFLLGNRVAAKPLRALSTEAIGWLMILLSLVLFDSNTKWPGWQATLPVMGTACIIASARSSSRLTNHWLTQWLGTRSYSIYLWHWPIVVGLIYIDKATDPLAITLGILLSLALGALSFTTIEGPSRKGLSSLGKGWTGAGIVASCVAVGGLSVGIVYHNGVMGRLPTAIEDVFMAAKDRNPRESECHVLDGALSPECHYGGSKLGVIVLGDSHAQAVVRAVEKSLPSQDLYALDWTVANCSTLMGIKRKADPDYHCAEFLARALERSKNLPPEAPMIIVNRLAKVAYGTKAGETQYGDNSPEFYFAEPYTQWSPGFYKELHDRIVDTACEFSKTRKVFMLRSIPEMDVDVPTTMGRGMVLGSIRDISITRDDYLKRNAVVWAAQDDAAKQCGITVLDPLPYLCDTDKCYGSHDGKPVYFDDDHLNLYGAGLLAPLFSQMFMTDPMIIQARAQ